MTRPNKYPPVSFSLVRGRGQPLSSQKAIVPSLDKQALFSKVSPFISQLGRPNDKQPVVVFCPSLASYFSTTYRLYKKEFWEGNATVRQPRGIFPIVRASATVRQLVDAALVRWCLSQPPLDSFFALYRSQHTCYLLLFVFTVQPQLDSLLTILSQLSLPATVRQRSRHFPPGGRIRAIFPSFSFSATVRQQDDAFC